MQDSDSPHSTRLKFLKFQSYQIDKRSPSKKKKLVIQLVKLGRGVLYRCI